MVGSGRGGGGGSPLQITAAFLCYGVLNLFLNFFNKWALSPSGAGFSFPVFYSTWHMLASIIGSWILMLVRRPLTGMPTWEQFLEYKWEALALSVCTSINISCNNASLMLIGLFVNQVVKALSVLISMVQSYFILQRTYSKPVILTVFVIAIAAGLAVPFTDPSVTALGLILVVVATLASATKPVIGELLMKTSSKANLAPAALVFYDSCFSFVFMLLFFLISPQERQGAAAYMRARPATGAAILAAGSAAAFLYNITVFYFTLVASALAVMVATNLLKVLLIALAALMEHVRSPLNWAGIVCFFGAVVVYAYLTYTEKQEKALQAQKAACVRAAEAGLAKPGPAEERALAAGEGKAAGWLRAFWKGAPPAAPPPAATEKSSLISK